MLGQHRPVRVRDLLQALLELVHQLGHVRAARGDDGRDGLRARHQATVPECSAMIPPAVRIQRTSRRPRPCISAPSSRGPGKRLTELGRYEYAWSSPVTRPSSGTMRSNQSEKNVDRGGLVGVVISSTTTRPPGRTTRAISDRPPRRSEKLRAPKPTVAASNSPSA